MEDNSNLSINNMVEFAMSISMASLFADAMNSAYKNTTRFGNEQFTAPPRYIHVIVNGKTQGPLSLGEIISMIQSKDITPDTYMWKPGMADWKHAKDITNIGVTFDTTPPQMP